MKRVDKIITDLQKLYAKRSALDTQIQGIQMTLAAEVKNAPKPAAAEKPPAAAKKPAAPKKPAK